MVNSSFITVMPGAQLPAAIRDELLDPTLWREPLEKFARATNLAVALVDREGRQIGECLNPQPLWELLRARRAANPSECPFCLVREGPCTSVADALANGAAVFSTDRIGLVHFAVPLGLSGHLLGALIAGQVFDQHPEQLLFEKIAGKFGLSPLDAWRVARLQVPMRRATLESFADLLATLGRTALETRYYSFLERQRLTEMTRLRDQLQVRTRLLVEADQHKDDFLAMLGHELRNPLGVIVSSLNLLDRIGPDEEQAIGIRATAKRHCHHLRRLVDDLLDVARLTQGKIKIEKQPVELACVVEEALQASLGFIEERQHKLTVSQPMKPVWIEGDPTRLTQILFNLLNNAAKYTRPGGQLWLSAEREGPDLLLKVRDNGIGMEPDLLSRIFNLFVQGQASLDHEQGGLGIGLAVVRRLTELHGGSVEASSAGPGQGSEFAVRLPALKARPASQAPASVSVDSNSRSRQVLIVEDNPDQASTLAKLLELLGHRVHVAHDGPAAVETARAHSPEIVLVDIGLPGMSGYQVARELRQQPELGESLLIALTGYGQEEDRQRSLEAGFDRHLVKPVEIATLQGLLASLKVPSVE